MCICVCVRDRKSFVLCKHTVRESDLCDPGMVLSQRSFLVGRLPEQGLLSIPCQVGGPLGYCGQEVNKKICVCVCVTSLYV